ncbi:MAG TPA: glycosyltransferase family 39 protein [Candidatus Dormibacteraeota bacterium]
MESPVVRSAYARGVVLLTAAGLAVRLLWLNHEPIWRDEAFTAVVEQRSIAGMLDAIHNDSAPPLSYLLTHVSLFFLGQTPTALRLTSAIAGTLIVPVGAALGRRCAGDRGGLWAAAVFALVPALVMSGRDARMYAMATTLVALSTLALWRATERGTPLRWAVYGLVMLLGLYTQYFVILAIPAQLIALRFALRATWRTVATAAGVSGLALLALVPWLVYAAPQFGHAETPFWVPPLNVISVSGTLAQFLSGPAIEPGTQGKLTIQAIQLLGVVGGLVCGFLLFRARKRLGSPAGFIAVCGGVPVAMLAAASIWHPILEARYAGVLWGPLFALLAVAIAGLNRLFLRALLMIALVAPTAAFSVAITHPDTPALTAYLEPRLHENDFIWASAGDYLLLLYYGDADERAHTQVVAHHIAWFWGTAAYPPNAVTPVFPASTIQQGGTIYWVEDAGHKLPVPPTGYSLRRYDCFSTICVATFSPSPP